jgi:hypothetical protein
MRTFLNASSKISQPIWQLITAFSLISYERSPEYMIVLIYFVQGLSVIRGFSHSARNNTRKYILFSNKLFSRWERIDHRKEAICLNFEDEDFSWKLKRDTKWITFHKFTPRNVFQKERRVILNIQCKILWFWPLLVLRLQEKPQWHER